MAVHVRHSDLVEVITIRQQSDSPPRLVDNPAVGEYESRFRSALGDGDLLLQLVRQPNTIVIDEGDELSGRMRKCARPRRGKRRMRLANDAQSLVAVLALNSLGGSVGQAIVDDDDSKSCQVCAKTLCNA